jgi:hypothetical protein
MPTALSDWENELAKSIQKLEQSSRIKTAVLLPLVPSLPDWDEFKISIKADWLSWKRDLLRYRACLVMLYSGLAYHEYDENTFWPQFAEAVGSEPLPANRQQEINGAFAEAAKFFALPVKHRNSGTDVVGSAVHYIGVPLSLWDGFLAMCEWALWRKDWKALTDSDWTDAVNKRSGSRQRLKNFLTYNRELATDLIQDMLDVREILATNPDMTLESIAQASILRTEYFDEVPETADFLRPGNPDSLFQGRARIVWNERHSRISVQVPGVSRDKLPATWHIGAHSHPGGLSPDELPLNGDAFCKSLLLTLASGNGSETQRLRGLSSWGLFDMDSGGRLVDPNRDELPLKSYLIVSQKEIGSVSRSGFDDADFPVDERFELADGSICFTTRLWPKGKPAELRLEESPLRQRIIRFRTRSRIEARFFVGWGRKAAYFTRTRQDEVTMGHLPILCVSIPSGYFSESTTELARNFKVLVDARPAQGRWEFLDQHAARDSEFYYWKWDKRPFLERKPGVSKLSDFAELTGAFKSPDLRGRRTFSIEAAAHICVRFNAEIVDRPSIGLESCWKNLPGAFLPFLLLCQSAIGMKWEDLLLAKDMIAPESSLSPYLLHKYAQHGILLLRGHRWEIRESRAEIVPLDRRTSQLKFCGDPSKLWGLYKQLSKNAPNRMLPMIEVTNNKGEVPYLQMDWPQYLRDEIEKYFKHNGVVLGPILWSH